MADQIPDNAKSRAAFALAVSKIDRDARLSDLTNVEIDGLVAAVCGVSLAADRHLIAQIVARAYGGSLHPELGTPGDYPVDEVDYRVADAILATRAAPPAMDREAVERPYRLGWLRGTNPDGWDEDDDVTHGDLAFDRQMREDLDSDYPAPSDADAPQTDKHHSVCGVHDDYDCDCAALRRAGVRDDVDAVTISALVRALEWYRDTVGQCRMMHSEGDDARNALHKDCGARANDALSTLSADALRQGEGVFRPYSEWNEDDRDVLWWKLPVQQAPYVGSPLDLGFAVGAHLYNQFGEVIGRTEANVGGWPFSADDEADLVWSRLPATPATPASHASDGGKA